MSIKATNINSLWGSLIIDELVRNGVHYFCISPGSRSTPLTVGVAENALAESIIAYDERGAAFHALGYARATGKPAALICTSGTAVANYLPAVVEASMDRIPLIILSADRPSELKETGANQTIPQSHIFAPYLRWQFEFPAPEESFPLPALLTTIDQAVYMARRSPRGPVHLNLMFREPLEPREGPVSGEFVRSVKQREADSIPHTRYASSLVLPEGEQFREIADILNGARKGIILLGRLENPHERSAAEQLFSKLFWPVFPDVLSGFRLGHPSSNLIHYFDQLLLDSRFQDFAQPDLILHIGGQPVSKRLLTFLKENPRSEYIVVKNHPFRHDPAHRVTRRIESDIAGFCTQLLPLVKKHEEVEWLTRQSFQSRIVDEVLEDWMRLDDPVSEISAARLISMHITRESGLFLASSMPIRDMDMYGSPHGAAAIVDANRGASGIDGTIASALGFARGLQRPVTLLIGDLAFIHDLSSLQLLDSVSQPVTLVLVNNGGGGIFSFLPISQFPAVFEPFFATPHSLSFEKIAATFRLNYRRPETNQQLRDAYAEAVLQKKHTLIEVVTNREENYRLHQRIQKEILTALSEL